LYHKNRNLHINASPECPVNGPVLPGNFTTPLGGEFGFLFFFFKYKMELLAIRNRLLKQEATIPETMEKVF